MFSYLSDVSGGILVDVIDKETFGTFLLSWVIHFNSSRSGQASLGSPVVINSECSRILRVVVNSSKLHHPAKLQVYRLLCDFCHFKDMGVKRPRNLKL